MTTQNNPSEWLFLAANLSCLATGIIPGLVKLPRRIPGTQYQLAPSPHSNVALRDKTAQLQKL